MGDIPCLRPGVEAQVETLPPVEAVAPVVGSTAAAAEVETQTQSQMDAMEGEAGGKAGKAAAETLTAMENLDTPAGRTVAAA